MKEKDKESADNKDKTNTNTTQSDNKNEADKNKDNKNNEEFSQFELDCLAQHNLYRKRHHSCDLVLNKSLCEIAASYAKVLLKEKKELEHSDNLYKDELMGENLFYEYKSSGKFFGKSCVRAWYAEKIDYDFSGESDAGSAGHFTQLLWNDTKELGVGYAAENGHCYVVCNYYPMGNYIHTFAQNVFKE